MNDIRKLVRIQIGVLLLFIVFKIVRSKILSSENNFIQVVGLSLPNLFEGILGVLILTALGLTLTRNKNIKHNYIYILAIIFAAIYVITQEFKIHNLGGKNVYDSNDVLFSLIGLFIGTIIVFIIKPKIETT
ncbi:hypothetical protein [uncultured Tenacibaculum sp.]|uniref:hypothetical protein n=1 Tax=uncultured Tenacibaculum sp. TaxID=174713 RepID=UPI00262A896F|nr:hypothetical protein [uncultured Tenacibaculum sp.]